MNTLYELVDEIKSAYMISSDKLTTMSAAEFGRLFLHYKPRFTTIARRYVRSETVAEDVVSDSFMTFWDAIVSDKICLNKEDYPPYILTIIRNKCLDWLRAESRHTRIEHQLYELRQQLIETDIRSLEAFDPKELFCSEVALITQQTLSEMPELTRNVFIAKRFKDMSYKEIASLYTISERKVEFELDKAMKQMRISLKDYLPFLLILLYCKIES